MHCYAPIVTDSTATVVYANLPIDQMHAPVAGVQPVLLLIMMISNMCMLRVSPTDLPSGPAHPYRIDAIVAGVRNHRAGHVEDTNLHSYIFDEQYNSYMRDGYAMAPGGEHYVVNAAKGDDGAPGMMQLLVLNAFFLHNVCNAYDDALAVCAGCLLSVTPDAITTQ